jgi:hypothetical protein
MIDKRRWTEEETRLLRELSKKCYAAEAIALRLERPLSAIRRKARRERIRLNEAIPLPELDADGRLKRLGGLDIPQRLQWIERPNTSGP